MIFSEKLYLLRKNRGYTQEELAEKICVSRQAIAKWESGQSYPDIANLIQIEDTWLQIICTGLIIGFGLGLIMRANASTGGMDTVGLIINKYCKLLTVGGYLVVLDVIVMVTQIPSAGLEKFIFGIILAIIYSITIDKVMISGKSKVELLIISNKQQEVRDLIINEFDRGVTFLHSKTGYLSHEIDTIMTVVDIRELNKIKDRVYALDSGAFMVVNKVTEVAGRGFTSVKKYKSQP